MEIHRSPRAAVVLRVACVLLLFVVLPLVSTPWTLDVREPARRVVIALVLAGTTGLWWVEREDPRLPRAVWWAMGSVALAATLATWASTNSWLSVIGRFPRDEGLLMIGAYLAMLPAGAILLARQEGRTAAVWGATASGWVLVWMALRDVLAGQLQRVTTALGNASTVGIWGLMLCAWLGWLAWRERSRVALLGSVAGGALVVLGASRGAMLGLVVGVLLSLVLVAVTEGVRRAAVPAGLLVAGVATVLVLPITRSRIFLEQEGAGANITVRLMMWRRTVRLIADEPLLGVGPSRWVSAVDSGYGPDWQAEAGPGVKLDAVHNVVLQTASTLGVVGLAAVTFLAVASGLSLLGVARRPSPLRGVRAAWPTAGLTVGVSMAVALMFAYTEPVFVVPGTALVGGALTVGHEAVGAPGQPAELQRGAGWRRPVAAAAAVVAGAAVLATTAAWWAYVEAQRTVMGDPRAGGEGLGRTAASAPWDPNPPTRLAQRLTTVASARGPWNPSQGADATPQRDALESGCRRIGPDQTCLAARARAEVQAGQPEVGATVAERALAMGPDDHLSRTAQQEALLALDRPGDAVRAAEQHRDRNPDLFTAWAMLARAQWATGDLRSAQESQARADQLLWALLDEAAAAR